MDRPNAEIKSKTFKCNVYCKTLSSKGSSKEHNERVHFGIKYDCNQCNESFKTKGALNSHVEIKHNGVRHQC